MFPSVIQGQSLNRVWGKKANKRFEKCRNNASTMQRFTVITNAQNTLQLFQGWALAPLAHACGAPVNEYDTQKEVFLNKKSYLIIYTVLQTLPFL